MPVAHRVRRSALPRCALVGVSTVLLVVGLVRLAPAPSPAAAAVTHEQGYRATVDGFTSWYGSYHLGPIGTAWCIDHGSRAPDPDLAYVPTDLPGVPVELRSALAWVVGRHGPSADRVTAAALMLVAHDLMGAVYPGGDLDVDLLPAARLAGFGGAEHSVLDRARALKADALAHAHLRPGWVLEVAADTPVPGATGMLSARLLAGGVPAGDVDLQVSAEGAVVAAPDGHGTVRTGADGVVRVPFVPAGGPYELRVDATVPDLEPRAFAPTLARAQRVVQPALVPLTDRLAQVATAPTTTVPPTTTTTTAPTTTTTAPPTTTTTTPPTTTTTSTTSTSTTSTSTTAPPSTTTTTAPTTTTTAPVEVLPRTVTAPPSPTSLPRTGGDPLALGSLGAGAVLLGWALRPRRRPTAR